MTQHLRNIQVYRFLFPVPVACSKATKTLFPVFDSIKKRIESDG